MREKGFTAIFLAIILIVIMTLGAMLYYFNNQVKREENTNLQNKPVSLTQQASAPAILKKNSSSNTQTSNSVIDNKNTSWLTYSTDNQMNADSNFYYKCPNVKKRILSIKYPGSWKLEPKSLRLAIDEGKSIPAFFLFKEDPNYNETQSGDMSPNNHVDLDFRLSCHPDGVDLFNGQFSGIGFLPTKTTELTINDVDTTFAYGFLQDIPETSAFKLDSNTTMFVNLNYLSVDGQECRSEYCKDTRKEINSIIKSVKFSN